MQPRPCSQLAVVCESRCRPAGRPAGQQKHGFSLIELMIVVAITGVLATIAVPTFTGYIQRARTSEAVQFLGVIKLRQEAYRSEFGGYLACGTAVQPSQIVFTPADAGTMKNAVSVAFPTDNTCFNQLGAKPDGAVRFGYGWAAGAPGDLAAAAQTLYGLTTANQDQYFIAQAVSDLDGDGTACIFELTSFTRNVWIGQTGGGALAAGWE